ncbi:MAG: nuclear transport factor 2 family protein [Steroidobacteraceae bacterium]
MAMRSGNMALAVAAAATWGCTTPPLLADAETARTNTHTVLAFEETLFNKHRVEEAFGHYIARDFKDHGATLPGRVSISQYPDARIVIERTVAQRDLVAVQVHWDQRPGQPHGVDRVDIFRLNDSRIVEHWGVAQDALRPGLADPAPP